MHSHERTMLAKFGFADPDRRQPLHDHACQYLTTPDAVARLIRHLSIEGGPEPNTEKVDDEEETSQVVRQIVHQSVRRECAISKGSSQFQTTIGFIDLLHRFRVEMQHCQVKRRLRNVPDGKGNRMWSEWRSHSDYTRTNDIAYGIEVKAAPVPIGDVLRQLELYRSYSTVPYWIVATTYPLAQQDLDCLKAQRLQHIYLGANFRAYVEGLTSIAPVVNLEI